MYFSYIFLVVSLMNVLHDFHVSFASAQCGKFSILYPAFDIFHRIKMITFIINVALYIEIRFCSQRVY